MTRRVSRDELRAQILEGWALDAGALPLFEMALDAREEYFDAKDQLARKIDKAERSHWTRVARDARLAFYKGWRQLNLDVEVTRDHPGRPGAR